MPLGDENAGLLLQTALHSIEQGLESGQALKVDADTFPVALQAVRASFVTLNIDTQLRGCIGRLEASRPLVEDVAENAFSAAFHDPRFQPIVTGELKHLKISLSILTPAEPLDFSSEQSLLAQLQPGVDGLIFKLGNRRGTFLPSVWESLPDPKQFLAHLKQKAGFAPDFWSDDVECFRYHAEYIQ
jgi:uncharacterized protein